MDTDRYLALFYPFDQLDLVKRGIESAWKVSGDRDDGCPDHDFYG